MNKEPKLKDLHKLFDSSAAQDLSLIRLCFSVKAYQNHLLV